MKYIGLVTVMVAGPFFVFALLNVGCENAGVYAFEDALHSF